MGDFNEILSASEHSNLDIHASHRGMRDFKECINRSVLFDIPASGNTFAWTNRHISKKLDRVLSNDAWLQMFPDSIGVFGELGISDHAPCCVFLDQQRPRQKRPFKFYAHLNNNSDFLEIIKGCWKNLSYEGTRQFVISKKLKQLKSIIRSFCRQNFSNLEKRVQEACEDLTKCQQASLIAPSPSNADAEALAHKKWFILARAEDSFLKQRSRIQWTSEGDANTAFYHRVIKTRRDQNQIHFLEDENGGIIDSLVDIKDHAVGYYKKLLGGDDVPSNSSPQQIASLMSTRCSHESQAILSAPFTRLEIQEAFFSLPKNKSPGPDGYPSEFFIGNWAAIGNEMIDGVSEFLRTGNLLNQWNATILTLIPKTPQASKMTDFRPIACCNSVYKVASKLLANRLKKVLPLLISPAQSAFIPGRLLVENVLLATEMVKGYNWKTISKRCMLKLDLRKAFDTLNWDFIQHTLEAMEFPVAFRKLIRQCITTASYSVAINGELCGYFRGTRGLRQGDPLSPYLFVLSLEVFSQLLQAKYVDGSIGYHPNATEPSVTHLAFADDIMIFSDGKKESLEKISQTFDEFGLWSGLRVNFGKTELYLAGTNQADVDDIASISFNLGTLLVRYLGLPLMHRKLRLAEYRPLIEKVTRRFTLWSAKALSYAGRLQLISSVIYGTINFWTSAFILPKGCLKLLQSLCSKFLWSGQIDRKASVKVAWSKVTLPKREGGLGLRNFGLWNTTLCLKLIWLLYSKSSSLWAAWIKSYRMFNGSFWSIHEDTTTSWTFRSLLKLRPVAARFLHVSIGSGRSTSFWWDNWTSLGPLWHAFGQTGPRQLMVPLNAYVSDVYNGTGWLLRGARSHVAVDLQIYLTAIVMPTQEVEDSVQWCVNGERLDKFSASKTWEEIRNRDTIKPWTSNIWFKDRIPRQAFHMWIAHQDRLPTRARLASWGLNINTVCSICNSSYENRDHIMLTCRYSEEVWGRVLQRLDERQRSFANWNDLLEWLMINNSSKSLFLKRLATQATLYYLWFERNRRHHDNVSSSTAQTFKTIDRCIRDAILGKRNKPKFRNLMQEWLQYE